jgi:hypothetical protein
VTFKSTHFPSRAQPVGGRQRTVDLQSRRSAKEPRFRGGYELELNVCEVQILYRLVLLAEERGRANQYRERRLLLGRIAREALSLTQCGCDFHTRLPVAAEESLTANGPLPTVQRRHFIRVPRKRAGVAPQSRFVVVDCFTARELMRLLATSAAPRRFRTRTWESFQDRVLPVLKRRQERLARQSGKV